MQTDAAEKHGSQEGLAFSAFESGKSLFPGPSKGLEPRKHNKCIPGFL